MFVHVNYQLTFKMDIVTLPHKVVQPCLLEVFTVEIMHI